MNKISILIILPSLAGGGAEKVTLSLLENLDSKFFVCNLILLNACGPLEAKINSEHIINLKKQRFLKAFPLLIKQIKNIKPDIILSTFPHITLPLLLIRKFLMRNTIIISREPNMIKLSLKNSPYSIVLKTLHKLLLPTADKVIVNSQAMYNDLSNRGIKLNKLALVHNPIDHINIRKVSNFNRHAGKGLRLIAMGRLVKQKGFDRLIPILKNLKNAHLTILGEGQEYNNLINLVKNLDLESKVDFKGYIKNPYSLIAGADYFILPSRWEGLPNAALESLVLGTPVISFKEVEGLVDIFPHVKNNNLYLCENEYDMEELLKKLSSRLDYKKLKLRKNLLSKFNTPFQYSKKISILLRGLVF
ncbi:glycosyltransferase [Alphaproteobacteria bacterium]|nr:glycosyltransferase [Alphaproteobacteria bacterium]